MTLIVLLRRTLQFYLQGFQQMTWGRTLWLIILIKLFVMFAILRLFFFHPTLRGSSEEKQEQVGTHLITPSSH